MLDFLILAVFAYLIFRIVHRIFFNIEQLFTKDTPPPTEPAPSQEKTSKPQQDNVRASPSKVNLSPPVKPAAPKHKNIISRDSNKPAPSEKLTKVNEVSSLSSERQDLARRKAEIQRQDTEMLRAELSDSLAQNLRLRQEIEAHKAQKAGYVARIEQIIQHVMDNQAPAPEIPAEQKNNAEMKALGELTKEIDHVHQHEVQRLREREQFLGREKEMLERHYLSQIDHFTQEIKSKTQQLSRQAEDIQTIKQNQEYLKHELAVAQQESDQLRTQLQQTQVLPTTNTVPNNSFYEESIKRQAEELSSAKQQIEDLKGKLRELREQSNISQNDKLEADIKLTAKVESLQNLKTEMEAQIAQLNEALFREEQDRNRLISQAKQEMIFKYQTETETLSKNLEKEQDSRKQVERKFSQLQSELQFVQDQLKSTLESERKLTAQVEALRSPKKISLTDVQSHPEYLKIKSKVQLLEGEIRSQQSQILREGGSSSKINYANTKVERQASPTFQFDSKQRTPSSRSKDVVSTIFVSGIEKPLSPSVTRYQTPLQKPVAQSSILEGGLLSEGFLGETNILGQKQREFLIGEIKTLKKIDVKKARLLYRSLGSNPRSIAEYTSNVPNVLVVVELSNKKLLGAFTQAAFTRQLANQPERKYSPANKAMLIDISEERVVLNSLANDTIRYDERALIWGRNEFVVSSEEPLLLSLDLNCEQAVYPCAFSNQEFLGSAGRSCPISQFEVYRIFLG